MCITHRKREGEMKDNIWKYLNYVCNNALYTKISLWLRNECLQVDD